MNEFVDWQDVSEEDDEIESEQQLIILDDEDIDE